MLPMLDALCPMHVQVAGDGRIVAAGPTMRKLRSELPIDHSFDSVFEVVRPAGLATTSDLIATTGVPLRLRFRDPPATTFKGIAVPDGQGGALVNLSFGISLLDALQTYDLTSADFDPTDLSIEMLYLIEAKSAAMDASRTLNRRLQVARVVAEEQAQTDTLTGLKNRRALEDALHRLIAADAAFAVMHLDLDHFKDVNDTLGHAAGDFVLQEATRRMLRLIREKDVIARVGGDEFILVFAGEPTRDALTDIATRLIEALEAPMLWDKEPCTISASAGIAIRQAEQQADALIARADAALYRAKRAGRARFQFCTD